MTLQQDLHTQSLRLLKKSQDDFSIITKKRNILISRWVTVNGVLLSRSGTCALYCLATLDAPDPDPRPVNPDGGREWVELAEWRFPWLESLSRWRRSWLILQKTVRNRIYTLFISLLCFFQFLFVFLVFRHSQIPSNSNQKLETIQILWKFTMNLPIELECSLVISSSTQTGRNHHLPFWNVWSEIKTIRDSIR